MGKIEYPEKVKLVIPTLFTSFEIIEKVSNDLIDIYGEMDYKSDIINFNFTDYYNKEMGTPIYRIFFSFKNLINSEELANIKIKTNELEQIYESDNKRKINLDPGYLELSKFILATTKNYSHRIHLGKGIFAEITLVFKKKSFTTLEMTYLDYRSNEYIQILNKIRKLYKTQIENVLV